MKYSIPVGLPISEQYRLLAYLKVKFQPGYFFKCDIGRLARQYGKDKRTFKKLLQSLLNDGLIGEDSKAVYLRSWKYTTMNLKMSLQSFEASPKDIRDKKHFECLQLAAKVTAIEKTIRRGERVREWGCTNQISPSTGLLAKVGGLSAGKVTQLKVKANCSGLIKVSKQFEDLGSGTGLTTKILNGEMPGVFLKDGRLMRRKADKIESTIETYRIKNRKQNESKKKGTK